MDVERLLAPAKIAWHARELRARRVQREAIRKASCILVACVRNELIRMPRFLDHYRRLGVQHFLIVDNESTDPLQAYLAGQDDCSSWIAHGGYKAANFGMDWCNHLLARWGVGKWCLTVDPDEFLVFPHAEARGLRSLTRYMDSIDQPSLLAPLIDAYSDKRLSETLLHEDTDPFAVCPYFDRFNLTQRFNERNQNFWIQGGVRLRQFFTGMPERAPALNKVPLVKWASGLHYESSMHHLNRAEFNCTVRGRPTAVSGALFHFKYVNLLTHKAAEEMQRAQHYAGGIEYRAYLEAGDPVLWDPDISIRYRGTRQLQELGFMQAGAWF
jgi:Glycosyl transferase family 2